MKQGLLPKGAMRTTEHSEMVVGGIDIGDVALAGKLGAELSRVESLLVDELSTGEPFLGDATTHLIKAGGKRFRPLFALLGAQFGPDPEAASVVTAAAVVELVHLATLYHDDVMDEATMRRNAPTVNLRWSNSIAILAGDYLFAGASRLVSLLGPEAVRVTAETFQHLVTGQMRETIGVRDGYDPVKHYLQVVWEKTGSLIALAGRLGATGAGARPEYLERITRVGDLVGTAFQISDDIIDITSASDQSGKTPGTDLREGVYTLPVLYALAEHGAVGDRLRALLAPRGSERGVDKMPLSDAEITEALELLERSTGPTQAEDTLRGYVDKAFAELSALPSGPATAALTKLVAFTVDRVG